MNSEVPPYLDYIECIDPQSDITFEVNENVVVSSKTSIKIVFKAKEQIPKRTEIRFTIPYSWQPLYVGQKIYSIKSSTKGKIKNTISQLSTIFLIRYPMEIGDSIEFIYNESEEFCTAGEVAYKDKVQCSLDIKLPKEKLFRRIGKREIQMVADEAVFFGVKLPTLYQEKPVDIQIVALDQYGNRDYRYSGKVNIKGPDSINYPVETFLKEGYIEIKEAITFKNEYFPSSVVEDLLINRKAYGSLPLVPEIIKNIAKIVVESAEETENGNILKGVSNPIVWDKDYVKKQLFFGDTHIHTREFSEGMGTGEDAFNYAKNNSLLDFAALGDHLNQRSNLWMDGKKFIEYPLTQEEWNKLVNLCEKYTDESFVAIPGYEWSARIDNPKALNIDCPYEAISDKVILFPLESARNAPLVDYFSAEGCFQDQLYNALKNVECTIISHTTASISMGTSWAEVDNNIEKVVEIYSQHGSSEEYGGYRHLAGARKKGTVKWALTHGLKLGFIGGGDDHYTHPGCTIKQHKLRTLVGTLRFRPGLAAIFSEKLKSKNLINQIKNRNCYATTGERIWVKIKINSALMGSEIEVNEPPIIIVTTCGTKRVEGVELIKNGEVIDIKVPGGWYVSTPEESCLTPHNGNDRIKFAIRDKELKNGEEAYYYVRVTQFEGERAWSSPIWVKAKYD